MLFSGRVYAGVIKDLGMGEYPGLLRWALNSTTGVPMKERRRCDCRGTDWSDTPTSPRMPGATGKGREVFSEGRMPCPHLPSMEGLVPQLLGRLPAGDPQLPAALGVALLQRAVLPTSGANQ